jgi:threonine aldolase
MKPIDLRSDTLTRPTPAMRAAMATAEVGDDVYGEDPSVNRLEALAAERLGTEAALFVCSGTQSNLLALLAHCERGDEYIVGQQAHCYRFEGGGAAVLGGIQPQPLDFQPDGSLDLAAVAAAVKPDDSHFARTRLLCLENTQGGKVLALDYLCAASRLARSLGLALHLDGARAANAAVALGVPLSSIAGYFDSISLCLSKGLGAPVGSVLCGRHDFIAKARRWRKVVGGGMRQAGILAAAGSYALEQQYARLADDHANARRLAEGLAQIPQLAIDPAGVQTNMLFLPLAGSQAEALTRYLKDRGILVGGYGNLRLVTHLDVSAAEVERVVEAVKGFFRAGGGGVC